MLRDIPTRPSTNIASVQWDDESTDLYITFQKGGVYRYQSVPEDIANGFSDNTLSPTVYLRLYIESEFFPIRMR